MSVLPYYMARRRALGAAAASPVAYSFTSQGVMFDAPAGMPTDTYWPSIVDMVTVTDFPYDWAIYFSTNHDTDDGGIWLYCANGDPTDSANWVSYDTALAAGDFNHIATKPAGNPIFQYDSGVVWNQTETPDVHVLGSSSVVMFAHNNDLGNNQSTFSATSPNGVQFTFDAVEIDYDPAVGMGDGHTGYFRYTENPFAGLTAENASITHVGYCYHGGNGYRKLRAQQVISTDGGATWTTRKILPITVGRALQPVAATEAITNAGMIWAGMDMKSIRALSGGTYSVLGTVANLTDSGLLGLGTFEIELNDTGDEVVSTPIQRVDAFALPDGIEYGSQRVLFFGANPVQDGIICYTSPIAVDDPAFPALDPAIPVGLTVNLEDFTGSVAPSGAYTLRNATGAVNALGYRLSIAATTQGVLQRTGFVPNDYDYIEFWGVARSLNTGGDRRLNMGFSVSQTNPFGGGGDAVLLWTNNTTLAGNIQLAATGATAVDCTSLHVGIANTEMSILHRVGLRWWPAQDKIVAIGENGIECSPVVSTAGLNTASTFYPLFGWNNVQANTGTFEIEQLSWTTKAA